MPEELDTALPPMDLLVWLLIAALPLNALIASLLTFGEELGWRGWLLPALRPMGTWPALILSGAVWGFWHAPLTLLGHNFGLTDWRGVLMMVTSSVAMGVLFGWLRLRGGSIWPAVIAHGSVNSGASILFYLGDASAPPNMQLVGPGIISWILAATIAALLVVTGQFKKQPSLTTP